MNPSRPRLNFSWLWFNAKQLFNHPTLMNWHMPWRNNFVDVQKLLEIIEPKQHILLFLSMKATLSLLRV